MLDRAVKLLGPEIAAMEAEEKRGFQAEDKENRTGIKKVNIVSGRLTA
jgi:hypothetical protein